MSRYFRWMSLPFVLVSLSLAVAQTTSAPATSTLDWNDVILRLGDANFQQRQTAESDLSLANYHQLDLFEHVVASTSDSEIKARLQNRIREIREDTAINPPPISVAVQNATLPQVSQALSKSLGFRFSINPPEDSPQWQFKYTVNIQDKPFWEVFAALNLQHGVCLTGFDGFQLIEGNFMRRGAIAGPGGSVAVFPTHLWLQKETNYQNDPGRELLPPKLTMAFSLAVDPRIRIAKINGPSLTDVVDDLGNVLCHKVPDDKPWRTDGRTGNILEGEQSLTMPEKLGNRIVSAKGQIQLWEEIAWLRAEFDSVETKLNQPLPLGGPGRQVFQLAAFNELAVGFSMKFQLIDTTTDPVREPVTITLVDADGRVWTWVGMTDIWTYTNYKRPLKLILSTPTKVREVVVPFEMKDLPLPMH